MRVLRSHDTISAVCYKLLLQIASCELAFIGLRNNILLKVICFGTYSSYLVPFIDGQCLAKNKFWMYMYKEEINDL